MDLTLPACCARWDAGCWSPSSSATASISSPATIRAAPRASGSTAARSSFRSRRSPSPATCRSEEHTSELQSLTNLVCRLLLEKKKKKDNQGYGDDLYC